MTAVLIKVLAVILITAVFALALSPTRTEYAFLLSISGGVAIMIIVIREVFPHIETVREIFQKSSGAADYFTVAVKSLGIAYMTGFVADTCRDFGQGSLAAKAEFAGKCAIFILCVPPAVNVLEAALKFAGI